MKHKLTSWIGSTASIISARLPEGRFKESLRSYLYRHSNPLYALNEIISKAELLQDGTLFVKLSNSVKYYGLEDKTSPPLIKYGKPEKLRKIQQFEHFGGFLTQLSDQYVEGVYERYYQLRQGDIVVDAGANIGTFSVKAAKAVGDTGKVIAIEPEANNLKLLQRNIEANELRNVVIVPKGVWSAKDKLKLNLSTQTMGQHSFYRDYCYGTDDTDEFEEVEIDTLDNILRELGIGKVDFIKMDIEGAEIEAIKGMHEILRGKVKLAVEAWQHIVDEKRTHKTIIPQLKERGFEVQREGGIIYARKRA